MLVVFETDREIDVLILLNEVPDGTVYFGTAKPSRQIEVLAEHDGGGARLAHAARFSRTRSAGRCSCFGIGGGRR